MTSEPISFSFGKNWEEFVRLHFSEERVAIAQKHLLGFLQMPDLRGKHFLDIGCGSGIHSLAAFKSGAARIVSIDLDPYSVKTTQQLRDTVGNPETWQVMEGSVLDKSFLATVEPADIVYSWGVLHHTGSMWEAIENAGSRIKDGGLFYIALYTTAPLSDFWLRVKKRYNRASSTGKRLMEAWYVATFTFGIGLLRLQNPIRRIREYRRDRGMSYLSDVKDWLGGYPFEHAKPEDVLQLCRSKLGLELINLVTTRSAEGNTEYLFHKHPADRSAT